MPTLAIFQLYRSTLKVWRKWHSTKMGTHF